ncbi:FecR family protein [Thermodesulfovibrio yellowstonii]|uniref:FecR family protein n=1 Tax=Thermodesulfovibrio yellowstonii TaxID=28262 RepID=UPI003C7D1352
MLRLKILILIAFISFLFLSNALAQEVGKITALEGKVDILRGGKPPAVMVKINEPVYLNDIIRTKTDSRAELTFRDGTVVKIAPRSRIDISEYFADAHSFRVTLNIPRGKAGAFVAKESVEKIKAFPKANRFEIKTPIAVAGVRGTNYVVAHYPTYSTVTVLTGKVYCYNLHIPERVVEVGAGQATVIREKLPPELPKPLTSKEIQSEQKDITPSKVEREGNIEKPFVSEYPLRNPEEPTAVNFYPETSSEPRLSTKETTPPITETTKITESLSVNFMLYSIEAPNSGEWKITYKVEANNPVIVRYRTKTSDWDEWKDVNTTAQNNIDFSINVYGSYEIQIKATDSYGNNKEWSSSIVYPKSSTFSGNIATDTSANSSVTGNVAGALTVDKGIAKLTASSPVSFNSTFKAGGGNATEGYWILKGPTSSSYFRLLTPTYLFTGSGDSTLTMESGGIKSLTTEPWIEVKELSLSAKFTGYHHYYDGTKIDEVQGGGQSTILIGKTGELILPSSINDTVTYKTENYGIGYIPDLTQDTSMVWGNFQQNSGSSLKLKGYAGGIGEDSSQNYAIYGLYIGSDGSAGILKGSPYGTNQNLYKEIHLIDIEPAFTFKKKTVGYSTMSTWSDYIQGSYQGYFTGGSGTPTISKQDISNTSYGVIGSATLSLKKGSNPESWGVFGIELGGSHSATLPTGLKLEFSGDSWDNRDASYTTPDYWLGSVSEATVSSGKIQGTFQGRFMTPTHYGIIEGKMFGNLGSNKWVGIVIGGYEPIVELSHLSNIVSDANTSKIYKENFAVTGARINSYLGGDSFWSKEQGSLYSMGKINDSSNEIDFNSGSSYLWYAPTNWSSGSLRYSGYIGGRFGQKTDTSYNFSTYVAGIYNDSTNKGIFIGNLSTDGTSNVLSLEKRFFLEGENNVKAVTLAAGSIPSSPSPAVVSNLSIDTNSYGITLQNQEGYIIMDTNTNYYTFGAGLIGMGGTYNTVPTGLWDITYTGSFEGGFQGSFGALLKGNLWGTENSVQNIINGKTYGYFADITGTPFLTGIFVGETLGTFDPTNKYWQAVTLGTVLETANFLSMACPGGKCNTSGTNFTEEQEKLRKLNIPVVEVGRASFSGSGNNLSVNMNNVIFFSTQAGQKPLLWSTADINGIYSGTPTLNQSVTLNATSGASGSVNFTPTYWSGGNWSATIANDTAYPIQLSGGSYNSSINMQGAASGVYGSGNFTGTASGMAK